MYKRQRLYDSAGMAVADLITLDHERIDESKPLTIFDPVDTWKKLTLTNFKARRLLVPVFEGGRQVYESPKLIDIQAYCQRELDTFWAQYKRLRNPHRYKVDLSDELWMLKHTMLQRRQERV